MTDIKDITVDEFIDAMEKNGLEKIRGSYYREGVDGIYAGCAFGQAAINLGVAPHDLRGSMRFISEVAARDIIHQNDYSDATLPEIAQGLRKRYSERFRKRVMHVRTFSYGKVKRIND